MYTCFSILYVVWTSQAGPQEHGLGHTVVDLLERHVRLVIGGLPVSKNACDGHCLHEELVERMNSATWSVKPRHCRPRAQVLVRSGCQSEPEAVVVFPAWSTCL